MNGRGVTRKDATASIEAHVRAHRGELLARLDVLSNEVGTGAGEEDDGEAYIVLGDEVLTTLGLSHDSWAQDVVAEVLAREVL